MRPNGSMLISGDVVDLELGQPAGREAGFRHPVIVVTAQEILDESAKVIQVVPLTSRLREFGSEVRVMAEPGTGLDADSSAQCQHMRSVSIDRVESVRGNVGPSSLSEIRQVVGLILDIA
ncbi:MAG: type II toxin-antitoxin system PemK/MazF family toxin [Actinomycetota bacterium]|nr:type II toxin-antitoxin system PemK/MazF family toxin [Actinomycetota bacterium]